MASGFGNHQIQLGGDFGDSVNAFQTDFNHQYTYQRGRYTMAHQSHLPQMGQNQIQRKERINSFTVTSDHSSILKGQKLDGFSTQKETQNSQYKRCSLYLNPSFKHLLHLDVNLSCTKLDWQSVTYFYGCEARSFERQLQSFEEQSIWHNLKTAFGSELVSLK